LSSLSSLYSLLDLPCKILIKSEIPSRSKVLVGQIKEISTETNSIRFLHQGKIESICLDSLIAVKPWQK